MATLKKLVKWVLIGLGALFVIGIVATMMSPDGRSGAERGADAALGDASGSASPSPTPTEEATEAPTSEPSAEPTPEATVDPVLARDVFLGVFANGFDESMADVPDAIEADFYWISSVDRMSYDEDANQVVIDTTTPYESVYTYDPQEWRDDTWTLYQSWATNIWASFEDGFESSADAGDFPWETWTPGLTLNASAGRLSVECDGGLIHRISQRDATQAEFEGECTFTP